MKSETKETVRTTIELPANLNANLLRRCEKTKRSRHAEMIYLLEKSFEISADDDAAENHFKDKIK